MDFWSEKWSDGVQMITIHSTRGYSIPMKYESHLRTLKYFSAPKMMIFRSEVVIGHFLVTLVTWVHVDPASKSSIFSHQIGSRALGGVKNGCYQSVAPGYYPGSRPERALGSRFRIFPIFSFFEYPRNLVILVGFSRIFSKISTRPRQLWTDLSFCSTYGFGYRWKSS